MIVADNTPVIIGVGQYSERVGEPGYEALSYMDLGGRALQAALDDCAASGNVAEAIDTICAIRQFEISYPNAVAPFGRSDNPPRSIGKRVGADPRRAILEITGGQGNQKMVGELASDIALGESDVAVIVGSEVMSTVRHLASLGETPDWSEEVGGQLEDRGYGLERYLEPGVLEHIGFRPIEGYAINENARRAKLGLSLDDYRLKIGELFEPFTAVAARNPFAAAPVQRSAAELAEVSDRNRRIADPYLRLTVARDQVNQAAAVIIASAAKAREIGVPENKWVHIHSVSAAQELPTMQRPDLSRSEAAERSLDIALGRAGKFADDMAYFDFYSCFAVPVFNAIEHLLIEPDDPRGLTLTGGLPFFGAPGNNYTTHAIAEAVHRLRADRGAYALVGANGGVMGKYATGIYSTLPASWSANDRYMVVPMSRKAHKYSVDPHDSCVVESYTVSMAKGGPRYMYAGLLENGVRVVGNADPAHEQTRALFDSGEPFGARLSVRRDERGLNIARVA